jgi:hypothetical protein
MDKRIPRLASLPLLLALASLGSGCHLLLGYDHQPPGRDGASDAQPDSGPQLTRPLVDVTAGAQHVCTLDADGVARCWGWNEWGMLGSGDTKPSALPVPVVGGVSFRGGLAGGVVHTCALSKTGSGRTRTAGATAAGTSSATRPRRTADTAHAGGGQGALTAPYGMTSRGRDDRTSHTGD